MHRKTAALLRSKIKSTEIYLDYSEVFSAGFVVVVGDFNTQTGYLSGTGRHIGCRFSALTDPTDNSDRLIKFFCLFLTDKKFVQKRGRMIWSPP